MNRAKDLEWFERNRLELSQKHPGRWLVVFDGQVRGSYDSEEAAVVASVTGFGINEASVFQAVPKDPVQFVAFEGERVWLGSSSRSTSGDHSSST